MSDEVWHVVAEARERRPEWDGLAQWKGTNGSDGAEGRGGSDGAEGRGGSDGAEGRGGSDGAEGWGGSGGAEELSRSGGTNGRSASGGVSGVRGMSGMSEATGVEGREGPGGRSEMSGGGETEGEGDPRYRALAARDRRFDGEFFFAVTTTGIYCRPVCPARTPKERNVRYFGTAAAAQAAGFRACLRCKPREAPSRVGAAEGAVAGGPVGGGAGAIGGRMRVVSGIGDRPNGGWHGGREWVKGEGGAGSAGREVEGGRRATGGAEPKAAGRSGAGDGPNGEPGARLAEEALALITGGALDGADGPTAVEGLAGSLNVTSRHLRRVLAAEVGASPLALARNRRVQTARVLLETTGFPVSEVAFSAGFGSIRQFNDTIREVFGVTPSELRDGALWVEEGGRRGEWAADGEGGARGGRSRRGVDGAEGDEGEPDEPEPDGPDGPDGSDGEVEGGRGESRVGGGGGKEGVRGKGGRGGKGAAMKGSEVGGRSGGGGGVGVGSGREGVRSEGGSGGEGPAVKGSGAITFRAAHRGPIELGHLVRWFAVRAIESVEQVMGPEGYRRTVRLPGGWAIVGFGPGGGLGLNGGPAGRRREWGTASGRSGAGSGRWGVEGGERRGTGVAGAGAGAGADADAELGAGGGRGVVGGGHVMLSIDPDEVRDLGAGIGVLRSLLDLDTDLDAVNADLVRADPELMGRLVRERPGLRIPGVVDGFEMAVRAVLGQQISVAAATTYAKRLVERCGSVYAAPGYGPLTRLFPTAGEVCEADLEGLGLLKSRIRTIRELAEAVAEGGGEDAGGREGGSKGGRRRGEVSGVEGRGGACGMSGMVGMGGVEGEAEVGGVAGVGGVGSGMRAPRRRDGGSGDGIRLERSGAAERERTKERLLALYGIGPWTVEYLAMRALGDPDAFPVGDLVLRQSAARLGLPAEPKTLLEHAERWRPWRSYAAMHLWADHAEGVRG